jgi:amino acid permease
VTQYAGYPPTSPPFRSAKALGLVAAAGAGLVTLLELAEVPLAWYSTRLLTNAADNGVAAWEVFTPYDAIGLPIVAVLAVTWVVTASWLTQTRHNAIVLNPWLVHARSTVWAWLGWWVPIVALWFPFQVVRDVRRATLSQRHSHSSVVGWWWALFLLYTVTGQVGTNITTSTEPNAALAQALGPAETLNAAIAVAASRCGCASSGR